MQDVTIPGELGRKCLAIVKGTKIPSRKRAALTNILVTRENMGAAASMPECRAVINRGGKLFRGRSVCNILGLATVALSIFYSFWLLLALLPILAVERVLASGEKEGWLFIAASLLALEILANDLAGWGKAYPRLRKAAGEALGYKGTSGPTTWMDLFLHGWESFDQPTLSALGPEVSPKQE